MKKNILLMLFMFLSLTAFSQTTVVGFDFNSSSSNAGQTATITAPGAFYSGVGCTQEGIANGLGTNQSWTMSAINTTGLSNMTVTYRMSSFTMGATGPFQLEYSINGGGSWTAIGATYAIPITGGCNKFNGSQSLPGGFENQATAQLRWRNTGSSGGGGNRFDDVLITIPGANTAPNAICQNITVQLNGTGNATITAADVDNGSNDAESGVTLSVNQTSFNCSNIGANTVTLTVTDAGGLSDTCTATVTVNDTTAPAITCPGNITQANDTGICGAVVIYTTPVGTDNCTGATTAQTAGLASGATFPVGTTTNTFLVTDGAGLTATCSFNVIINDTEAPTISCPGTITQANDAGICGAIVTYTTPVGTDNCTGVTTTQTAGLASGATFPVGTTTNTFVVTDAAGLTATCSFNVIINDTENPVITCPIDVTVECGSSTTAATGTTVANYVGGTQSWNTSTTGLVATLTADVVAIPATATITDVNVSFEIDHSWVGDLEITLVSPDGDTVLVLQDPTCGGSGNSDNVNATLDDESGVGTVSANCTGGVNTGGAPEPDACPQEYLISAAIDGTFDPDNALSGLDGGLALGTWTLQVVDDAGGDAGCIHNYSVTVDWEDVGSPFTDTSPAATGMATGTDNCGAPTITFADVSVAGCGNTETITRTWTATDGSGNTSTCDQIITVVDTTPPTTTCPANIATNNDPGICGAVVTYTDPVGTDTCNNTTTTQTAGLASGSTFPVGTTTNTFLIEDGCGNSVSCTFDVIVTDNETPVITCVANDTRDTDVGVCQYTVVGTEFDATFTDNCMSGSITNDLNGTDTIDGEILPTGDTTIVWIVDDGSGQMATCTTIITIEDNEDPVITCVASDSRDTDPGVCQYTIVGTEFDATFTDNCMSGSITNDLNGTATIDGEVLPTGNTTVVWTVDDGNGQTATCTTVITVEDNEDPVITCVANGTRDTDPGVCQYIVVGTEFDATFTDNCMSGSIINDLNGTATITGEILAKGDTTVVWTADDGNGQTATCTTVITVEDNEDPVITCAPNGTRDTDPGVCQYTVVGTEFDATFTDNCTDGSITNDLNGTATIDGEVLPTGDTTVVWTVDDGNGQTATCTTVITVEDNEDPIIACSMDVTANTDLGICGAAVIFADAIALDNCGIDTVIQSAGLPSGSIFPVGISTVEYTATDINGNVSVCSFTITVTDNEPAIAVCQDITIQLDANGDAMIVPADVDGGSTDNCGVASIAVDMDTFDCSNVGPNDVTLEVTDVNGNVSTCIAVVTVEDVTMPVVVCQDITVQLDATGAITILGSDVDGGSTDACGIASYDLDIDTFDCSNIGANNVVLTVTDVNGNAATCMAVVTVEDTTMPDLVCMDITLELGADGTAMITPADVSTATDACGINTTAVDIENFDCSDIGTPVTVMVFAIDNNGNLASCNAVVTVIDALAPVVTCPADQTVDPGIGNLFYEVPDYFALGEASATDNCTDPLTIFSQDPAVGTLLPDGVYTITMMAEDEYGNIGECTFELTIESVLGVTDNELNFESVVLYPNPAQEFVILNNPQSLALQQAAIYDLTGRLIQTIDLNNMGTAKTIDVSLLATARYVVVIQTEKGQITKQLLKK